MPKQLKQYLVFEVGCIECGCPSSPVATFSSEEEANKVAEALQKAHYWRHGGQNEFEVFDLFADPDKELQETLNASSS